MREVDRLLRAQARFELGTDECFDEWFEIVGDTEEKWAHVKIPTPEQMMRHQRIKDATIFWLEEFKHCAEEALDLDEHED